MVGEGVNLAGKSFETSKYIIQQIQKKILEVSLQLEKK